MAYTTDAIIMTKRMDINAAIDDHLNDIEPDYVTSAKTLPTEMISMMTSMIANSTTDDHDDHHHEMEHDFVTSVIATTSLTVIIVVSFFANTLATSTILRVRLLRENLHNYLIVNLNVVSMFITVFSMPLTLISIFDDGMLLEQNEGLCLFNGFSSIAFPVASSFTVLWIAVDRYLTVVWNKRFPPSRLRTILMIVSTWVISCIVAILPLFNVLSRYYYMHDAHHCSPVWDMCEYYFVVFFAVYGLSIPIMVISYMFVVYHLCKKERKMQSHQSFRSKSRFSRSERSVGRRSKRSRLAEREVKELGSSAVGDSSHTSDRAAPTKAKVHHDSGYVSPPKNSLGGNEPGQDDRPENKTVLADAVDVLQREQLNTNNSASTDDSSEGKPSRSSMCLRKGSVRAIIKQLETASKKKRMSKCDSLPKARSNRLTASNDLRKAASANDVLENDFPLADIYTDRYGSPRNTSRNNVTHDQLTQRDSTNEHCIMPSESLNHTDISSPSPYECYDEDDTVVITGFTGSDDSEVDGDDDVCRTDTSLLQNRTSKHHVVPAIVIDDAFESDSDDENPETPKSSESYHSQHSNSKSISPKNSLDGCLLAVHETPCVEETDTTPGDADPAKEETNVTGDPPGPQFSLSIELLSAPDKEHSSSFECQVKRQGSFASLSSVRHISGGGADASKLKRGSTRRTVTRPTLTADKQVALMGGLLVLTAVVCWTPYFVIHSCFFPMNIAPHWTSVLTNWLGYLNAMLNPLIYSFTNRRIRSMLMTFCGKRCRRLRELICRKRTDGLNSR